MTELENRKNSSDEGAKDERYRHFRKQNNIAAKQSRNAHKAKVEKAAKQAEILEMKNKFISEEIQVIKSETLMLKKMLEKYEPSI